MRYLPIVKPLPFSTTVCVAATVLTMLVAAGTAGGDEELSKEQQEILAYFQLKDRAEQLGRLILDGDIVDEQGQRLNGVRVKHPASRDGAAINKLYDALHGTAPVSKEKISELRSAVYNFPARTDIYSGTFHLDLKNIDTIYSTVEFSLDGYYSEKLTFRYLLESDPAIMESIQNFKLPKELVFKRTARVVLEKKGAFTKLVNHWAQQLEYAVDGTGKGLHLGTDQEPMKLQTISVGKDVSSLKRCLVVEAEHDERGIAAKFGNPNGWIELRAVPLRMKLKLVGADGGFIRYRVKKEDARDDEESRKKVQTAEKPINRQMKRSPDKGYVPELEIRIHDFPEYGSQSSVYFYFKVGNTFGSGSVGRPKLSADGKAVIGIGVSLQPDGSTNLETGE